MAAPLVSANFADLLDVRFRDIANGSYDKGKSRIPDLMSVDSSDRPDERYSEVTPLGKLPQFTGTLEYMSADQGYDVTASHVEYAGGIQIQRKLFDDDQFGLIDEIFSSLGDAAFKRHEDDAAGMLNSGFSAASSFYVHTEGVALFSASHTTPVPGVSTSTGFSNRVTSALSPVALTAALIQFRGFKDAQGDKIDAVPNELWVPIDLVDRANEILKTTKGLDEATGTINVHEGRFSLQSWYRLSDSNNWFLFDSASRARNLIFLWRKRFETGRMESFDNFIAKARCYMRYSMVRRDWRCGLGAEVS